MLKKISVKILILSMIVLLTCSDLMAQNRRVPDSVNSTSSNDSDFENKYRQVDDKLLETTQYELYVRKLFNPNQQCFNSPERGKASVVLVLKQFDNNYAISGENENYRRILEDEIIPILKRQCNSLQAITIINYFKGIRFVDSPVQSGDRYKEYKTSDPTFPGSKEFGILINISLNEQGQIRFETTRANSLTAIRNLRNEIVKWNENKDVREQEEKAEAERRALIREEEAKRQAEIEVAKKKEDQRAKASQVLKLYKKGAAPNYNFSGYTRQQTLQNIYSGNFEPFTGGYESNIGLKIQQDIIAARFLPSLDESLKEMSRLTKEGVRIGGLRLPIRIAYFAYHEMFEEQCYPKDQEFPWIKGTFRTDIIKKLGSTIVDEIKGQTHVYNVREPFFEDFDKTYDDAERGLIKHLLTGTSFSTRQEFQNDFRKFLKTEGCSSTKVRHFEVNLYLATKWLMPLQELLPPDALKSQTQLEKQKPQSEIQKTKPTVKKNTVRVRKKT